MSTDIKYYIDEFVEDEIYYFYAPQLDLYGYGRTKKEASEGLDIAIEVLWEWIFNKEYGLTFDSLEKKFVYIPNLN